MNEEYRKARLSAFILFVSRTDRVWVTSEEEKRMKGASERRRIRSLYVHSWSVSPCIWPWDRSFSLHYGHFPLISFLSHLTSEGSAWLDVNNHRFSFISLEVQADLEVGKEWYGTIVRRSMWIICFLVPVNLRSSRTVSLHPLFPSWDTGDTRSE